MITNLHVYLEFNMTVKKTNCYTFVLTFQTFVFSLLQKTIMNEKP